MKKLVWGVCGILSFLCQLAATEKVVLISGSTGGIGLETVRAFHREGWRVWAGYRKEIPETLQTLSGVNPILLDVTDEQSVQDCVKRVLEAEGKIDLLINNAGYGLIGAEEALPLEEVQRLFDVNYFGSLRLIQAVLPQMRELRSGRIINVSSTSGVRALGLLGAYAASKFALEALSEALAAELALWDIHVSIVEPGTVNNDWVSNCVKIPGEDPMYSFLSNALVSKLSQIAAKGQSCTEIAEVILKAANASHPDMRYQTSDTVRQTVSKKLSDPTGNALRTEQIQWVKGLLQ